MKPLWEVTFKVRAFDVDAYNRLKVTTMFDYFQDAASNHADELKVGYTELIPKGYFWVLSWAKLEIVKSSKFMDEITVQTWGKRQYKLYSLRDFLILDNNKKILCKATTAWLFLDAKSLRPKIMPQLYPKVIFLENKSAVDELPQKFQQTPPTQKIFSKEIKYSDIDLNKHTNNAKYIELLIDCYDRDFHKSYRLKNLTASFVSESKFGETIQISKSTTSDTDYIEITNLNKNKIVYQALSTWEKAIE